MLFANLESKLENQDEDTMVSTTTKTRPFMICADCEHLCYFEQKDPILCKNCGYRAAYKKRPNIARTFICR